jgi:hypothetical protein
LRAVVFDKKINQTWVLVIVYGAAQEEDKEYIFLSKLTTVCSNHSLPLLIGGDFNLPRFSYEKNTELKKSRNNVILNQVINLYELREIVIIGLCLHGLTNKGIQLWKDLLEC